MRHKDQAGGGDNVDSIGPYFSIFCLITALNGLEGMFPKTYSQGNEWCNF